MSGRRKLEVKKMYSNVIQTLYHQLVARDACRIWNSLIVDLVSLCRIFPRRSCGRGEENYYALIHEFIAFSLVLLFNFFIMLEITKEKFMGVIHELCHQNVMLFNYEMSFLRQSFIAPLKAPRKSSNETIKSFR